MPGMPWCSATQNLVKPRDSVLPRQLGRGAQRVARGRAAVRDGRQVEHAERRAGQGGSRLDLAIQYGHVEGQHRRGARIFLTPGVPARQLIVIDSSFGCNGVVAEFEHAVGDLDDMRIAIITESFPPDVNGVAHCVVRVAENLVRKGHHPLVIAPESARATIGADRQFRYPVERVPSVPLPGYPTFRLGLPTPRTRRPSPGTAPRSSTWPARSRSARGAPASPGPWTCRWSPSTRPTCRATPAPTASAGRPRRSPGAGCATSTTRRAAPSPRPA